MHNRFDIFRRKKRSVRSTGDNAVDSDSQVLSLLPATETITMCAPFDLENFDESFFDTDAPITHRRRTVSYPVTTTTGFMLGVADFLDKYKVQLIAKKLDPTDDIAKLRTDAAELTRQNGVQEGLKTDLKNQTALVEDLNGTGYGDASTLLDAAIGKIGKTTTEGKEGGQLRSKLNSSKKATPKPPTP
jgi:hypothetical protein